MWSTRTKSTAWRTAASLLMLTACGGGEEAPAPEVGEHVWTREEQDGKKWWRLRFESQKKLKSVVLDPERTYYLDGDMSNNQWYTEKDELTPWRWAERVFTQYTHLLHWHSDIGG